MKGNTLTFHEKKSLAAIGDTIGQAAFDAAFFMAYGVFWTLFLPFDLFLKIERFFKVICNFQSTPSRI
jgi:hypothetical protein